MNFRNLARQRISNDENVQYTPQQRRNNKLAHEGIQKGVLRKKEWWKKSMRVKDGGKIVVLTAGRDNITRTYKINGELEAVRAGVNPQFEIIREKNWYHQTAQSEPGKVVDRVDKVLVSDKM